MYTKEQPTVQRLTDFIQKSGYKISGTQEDVFHFDIDVR
jgi:hypothetical protein